MNTTISSGQMVQFLTLMEQKAMTVERFQKLLSSGILADVCDIRADLDRLIVRNLLRHRIDCSADPFIPREWNVQEHHRGGVLEWHPDAATLYLAKQQEEGVIAGDNLWEELKGRAVLNANVLDYLLGHRELIPDKWRGKTVFFWGTIYHIAGLSVVRCLYSRDGTYYWSYRRINMTECWSNSDPAIISV